MSKSTSYLRQQAREKFWNSHDRGEYECADCGRCEDELLENFEVHHIDGDVSNNASENLIGVCQVCHNLREGKRASVRKTSHLISQFSGDKIDYSNAVPVCRDEDEYKEHVNYCFEEYRPALLIDKRRARKWIPVEVDLMALSGAFEFQTDDGTRDAAVALTDEACLAVRAVLEKYEKVETGGNGHQNLFFPKDSASGFHTFPGMRLDNAQRLASELKLIFENPINWRVKTTELKWYLRDHDSATIQMKQLEWLSQHEQRQPWTVEESDLLPTCPRCGDVINDEREHCESCARVLRWKYASCDHEDLSPTLNNPYWECSDCGLQKPDQPMSPPAR